MADQTQNDLTRIDRAEVPQGNLADARRAITADPVTRPDVAGMMDRVGRLFGRGTQRDQRDTSRSSRR